MDQNFFENETRIDTHMEKNGLILASYTNTGCQPRAIKVHYMWSYYTNTADSVPSFNRNGHKMLMCL